MQTRISYGKVAHEGIKAMAALEQYLRTCGLEKSLLDLVMLRASQINGCAVCMDAHWKELRGAGENEHRLYSLDAWRESPYYTERERAALAWAESITLITDGHVPNDVYEQARRHDQEREHDSEVTPKSVLYVEPEEGAFLPPHSPNDGHTEP